VIVFDVTSSSTITAFNEADFEAVRSFYSTHPNVLLDGILYIRSIVYGETTVFPGPNGSSGGLTANEVYQLGSRGGGIMIGTDHNCCQGDANGLLNAIIPGAAFSGSTYPTLDGEFNGDDLLNAVAVVSPSDVFTHWSEVGSQAIAPTGTFVNVFEDSVTLWSQVDVADVVGGPRYPYISTSWEPSGGGVGFDCNDNGILDSVDIAEGTSADVNENGIPDECEELTDEGIALSPARAHLDPGAEVTVTALVLDAAGEPADAVVSFSVEGSNAGVVGTCSPNPDCSTDENGEASFTYTGAAEPGWDTVVASATVDETDLESNQALVLWGSGIYPVSDWAESFDHWTYEDDDGVEHTIGFLAARSDGVHVLDVTNPLDVQPLGSYQPGTCDTDGGSTDFFADDVTFAEAQHAIYIAAGACGVHIVDVAGARNPGDANRPQAFGPDGPPQLEAYDAHVLYGTSWVEAVAVRDGVAYVADYDALRIFDVSEYDGDPATSDIGSELGSLGFNPDVDGPVGSVALYEDDANERLLALVAVGGGMRVVDVSTDPSNPDEIAAYEHPSSLGSNAITQDIAVDPRRRNVLLPAWVGGLSVVGIGDTDNPTHVTSLSPASPAFYTAVPYEGRIFATEGTAGLRVLDLVDDVLEPSLMPPDRIEVGSSPGDDWAWDVAAANCVAYVTFGNLDSGEGGLQLTPLPVEACESWTGGRVGVLGGESDSDADGVADAEDNCLEISNADQADADLDGFGNACDADYDNDGSVGLGDFGIFSAAYGATASDDHYDARADHDANDVVALDDFGTFSQLWESAPGPSGLSCAGSVPCP
jgi:hypothetical protein